MKLTVNEIYNLWNALNEAFKERKMRAKTTFLIARNVKALEPIIASVDEARKKILLENGEQTEEGFQIKKECLAEVNKQLFELGNEEQEVDLQQIDFVELEQVLLTVDQALALEVLIKNEGE